MSYGDNDDYALSKRLTIAAAFATIFRTGSEEEYLSSRWEAVLLLWDYLKAVAATFGMTLTSFFLACFFALDLPDSELIKDGHLLVSTDIFAFVYNYKALSNTPEDFFRNGGAFLLYLFFFAETVVTSSGLAQTRVMPRFVRRLRVFLALMAVCSLVMIFSLPCMQFGVRDTGVADAASTIVRDKRACLYFSVVTWTTVGYGDYVPTPALRPIAALEAITGYFGMALFVAAFINASIKRSWRDS